MVEIPLEEKKLRQNSKSLNLELLMQDLVSRNNRGIFVYISVVGASLAQGYSLLISQPKIKY